jgi:hypothetical protein
VNDTCLGSLRECTKCSKAKAKIENDSVVENFVQLDEFAMHEEASPREKWKLAR